MKETMTFKEIVSILNEKIQDINSCINGVKDNPKAKEYIKELKLKREEAVEIYMFFCHRFHRYEGLTKEVKE